MTVEAKKFYFPDGNLLAAEAWLKENIDRTLWFVTKSRVAMIYLYGSEECTLFALMWAGKYSHCSDIILRRF